MNLVFAAIAALLLRRAKVSRPAHWLFLWLLASVSLLQATGYLLFSGVGNIGDWAVVTADLPGGALWKVALIVTGGITYFLSVRWSMRTLGAHLHTDAPARVREAYRYTLVVYFAGASLYVIAGMFDPAAQAILLISGVAASLGGTSGFAWGPQQLKKPALVTRAEPIAALERDWRWITAGIVAAAVFILVLGPGLRF
jgi:hypothetical protein